MTSEKEHGNQTDFTGLLDTIKDIKNKQRQAEAEKEHLAQEMHQLHLAHCNNLAEQQAKFYKIAKQVAHEIASPLAAINMLISRLENIPDNQRTMLKLALIKITDTSNNLVKQCQPDGQENAGSTPEIPTGKLLRQITQISQIAQPEANKAGAPPSPAPGNKVDIVMLEDDPVFASAFQFRFKKKIIKHYLDPRDFMAECLAYPKDTVISIDNNFGVAIPVTGIEIAAQLHEQGFTRLYLVSGTCFIQSELPAYLIFIEKLNLDFFDTI